VSGEQKLTGEIAKKLAEKLRNEIRVL